MPEISRFFGLVLTMNYNDHPPPHFHVEYGGAKAIIRIPDMNVLAGYLPKRIVRLVKDWGLRHRNELMTNWLLVRSGQPPPRIEPLE